jgi:two-component system sensor histidine kinase/response regulator
VARVLGRQTDSATSGFNVEAALIQVDGNEELLRRLAQLFFDACPMYLAGIEAAITGDDAPALAAAAHGLKGALNMLALSEPMEAALELEEMGKSNGLSTARDTFDRLERLIEALKPALAAFAGQAGPRC